MKTESYKWWEQVQSKLHQNFDNVRLSAEHILWLSENFPPAILKQADVIKSVCECKRPSRWAGNDGYDYCIECNKPIE